MNSMNWNFIRNGKFDVLPEANKRVRVAYTLAGEKTIADSRYWDDDKVWGGCMYVYAWRELEKPPELSTSEKIPQQALMVDHGNIFEIPKEDNDLINLLLN